MHYILTPHKDKLRYNITLLLRYQGLSNLYLWVSNLANYTTALCLPWTKRTVIWKLRNLTYFFRFCLLYMLVELVPSWFSYIWLCSHLCFMICFSGGSAKNHIYYGCNKLELQCRFLSSWDCCGSATGGPCWLRMQQSEHQHMSCRKDV